MQDCIARLKLALGKNIFNPLLFSCLLNIFDPLPNFLPNFRKWEGFEVGIDWKFNV